MQLINVKVATSHSYCIMIALICIKFNNKRSINETTNLTFNTLVWHIHHCEIIYLCNKYNYYLLHAIHINNDTLFIYCVRQSLFITTNPIPLKTIQLTTLRFSLFSIETNDLSTCYIKINLKPTNKSAHQKNINQKLSTYVLYLESINATGALIDIEK